MVALLVLDNFLSKIIFLVKRCEFKFISDMPHYRALVSHQEH